MTPMYLKPVEGRQVPDPERGGSLIAEGRLVERSNYWLRRLRDGDVVEVEQAAATVTAPVTSEEG